MKFALELITMQNFTLIGRRISEISRWKKKHEYVPQAIASRRTNK